MSALKYELPVAADHLFAIRAVALAHFAFAIFSFGFIFFNSSVEDAGLDEGVSKALKAVDTPQALALGKSLKRTGEIRSALNKHLENRLPSIKWVRPLDQMTQVGICLLLVAAGTYLYQRQPLGRQLSLGFAGVCLTQKLLMMGYLVLAEVPQTRQYLDQLLRMHPGDASLIQSVLGPISNSPISLLVVSMYPLIVLAVMLNPGIRDSLAITDDIHAIVEEPPPPSSTAYPRLSKLPSEFTVAQTDALDAMLQKRAY